MFVMILFTLNAYAGLGKVDKETFMKWFKQGDIYLIKSNAIICNNPKTLGRIYNAIEQNGGFYNPRISHDSWQGCSIMPFTYFARIKGKLYGGKIVKVDYAEITKEVYDEQDTEHKNETIYNIFTSTNKNYDAAYVLRDQMLSRKEYKQQSIDVNHE